MVDFDGLDEHNKSAMTNYELNAKRRRSGRKASEPMDASELHARKHAKRLLSIDPSTKTLGWALFDRRNGSADWRLVRSSYIRRRPKADWMQGIDDMVAQLMGVAKKYGVHVVVIEKPQVFGGNAGVAAANTESVMKLSACVWAIRQAMRYVAPVMHVELVNVNKWKGQTPKSVTQMRVRRHWGWDGKDHNEADAVGIGDWWIRKKHT